MIIAVPKELSPGETRVAATPDTVKKMLAWGFQLRVEKDAGIAAGFSNQNYLDAGAEVTTHIYEAADFILKIKAPLPVEEPLLKPGQVIIADFQALNFPQRAQTFAKLGTTCFALDLMPRISRAQSMDILSSQSNLAGYKAVIKGVEVLKKAVPMMMTAAGTVTPAKVLILGAGVAGLQAIATAKRLGAQVFASDVRPSVKEQVESLGARFLEITAEENFETAGGYASETSEEYKKRQAEAVALQLEKTDLAITTALIPGKAAPILINKKMLKKMPRGSVVIDMAAANGGNVEGSKNNETIIEENVTVIGAGNLPAEIPYSASNLFAHNIFNFLSPMYHPAEKSIIFDFTDILIKSTCICREGKVTMEKNL